MTSADRMSIQAVLQAELNGPAIDAPPSGISGLVNGQRLITADIQPAAG